MAFAKCVKNMFPKRESAHSMHRPRRVRDISFKNRRGYDVKQGVDVR